MAISLITDNTKQDQVSAEFTNTPGQRFTLSGFSKKGSNWLVTIQKKFSDNQWYPVRQFNSANPIITIADGGTFRILKAKGIECMIEKD